MDDDDIGAAIDRLVNKRGFNSEEKNDDDRRKDNNMTIGKKNKSEEARFPEPAKTNNFFNTSQEKATNVTTTSQAKTAFSASKNDLTLSELLTAKKKNSQGLPAVIDRMAGNGSLGQTSPPNNSMKNSKGAFTGLLSSEREPI